MADALPVHLPNHVRGLVPFATRRRTACYAHLRRYFHEAIPTAPIAKELLDLVAEFYITEHAADADGLSGPAKLEFRRERAGPIRARLRAWIAEQRGRHPPKSPIGTAIHYADNHWESNYAGAEQ